MILSDDGWHHTKNRVTPATLMMAPRISRGVTRWWKKYQLGRRMKMGVIAMMVWAIPVVV